MGDDIMAPYRKVPNSTSHKPHSEITNVQTIVPYCSGNARNDPLEMRYAIPYTTNRATPLPKQNVQVYTVHEQQGSSGKMINQTTSPDAATNGSDHDPLRTSSISVSPAAAEFITPATAKRAKAADWAK